MAHFGGAKVEWIDLSTGINRQPYPVPEISLNAWTQLPAASAKAGLITAAQTAYCTKGAVLPLAGAQAAIQLVPLLTKPRKAKILTPTYNEHAAALRGLGWEVEEVTQLEALAGAELAVVVNPNNPNGAQHSPAQLLGLLPKLGRLVVDESFGDPYPELSLAAEAGRAGLIVLRSFGKFYGLAGMRLGFALGQADDIAALSQLAGPWPVCGPALEIGTQALADTAWAQTTTKRLMSEIPRLDELAERAGWQIAGGSCLFRLYETPNATQAQERLARQHIWSRIFPYSGNWIRLGMPGHEAEWERLAAALAG